MYCPKCGTQTADDARFCETCGCSLTDAASSTATTVSDLPNPNYNLDPNIPEPGLYQPPQKKKTGLIVGLIIGGVAVLAIIALIAVSALSGSRAAKSGYEDYESLTEAYYRAFVSNNEEVIAAMVPVEVAEYSKEHDQVENTCEAIDYWYDNYGVYLHSWEITDVTEEDITEYVFDDLDMAVTRMYDVETTALTSDSEEVVIDLMVVEIDSLWYLVFTW